MILVRVCNTVSLQGVDAGKIISRGLLIWQALSLKHKGKRHLEGFHTVHILIVYLKQSPRDLSYCTRVVMVQLVGYNFDTFESRVRTVL